MKIIRRSRQLQNPSNHQYSQQSPSNHQYVQQSPVHKQQKSAITKNIVTNKNSRIQKLKKSIIWNDNKQSNQQSPNTARKNINSLNRYLNLQRKIYSGKSECKIKNDDDFNIKAHLPSSKKTIFSYPLRTSTPKRSRIKGITFKTEIKNGVKIIIINKEIY
eukprot:UN31939